MHKGNYIFVCLHGVLCPEVTSWIWTRFVHSVSAVVIIIDSQRRVFGAVTWSLRFQEYSKQTVWGMRRIILYVLYIQLGMYYTCIHVYCSSILSAGGYLILSMLWRFFFCQALKHSGRLIKSVPQAAAPIGSHTEKYSPSLSYITRKMRGCFEVHQSYFFFSLLAPSKKAAGARMLELLTEEEK